MTGRRRASEERRRAEKEERWQEKRYMAASCVQRGMSLRKAAAETGGASHQFVKIWAGKLLEEGPPDENEKRGIVLREGHEGIVRSRKPGPEPGNCPKVDEIYERVKKEKEKQFRKNIGAAKIRIMSRVDALTETVAKAVERAGYKPLRTESEQHPERYCAAVPNIQWDIDFVELGKNPETGRKVYSLFVEDDHSRQTMGTLVTDEATTDSVLKALDGMIREHRKPDAIRSDHGGQWYSEAADVCRFDEWCRKMGIRHTMSAVATPQQNGKVERFHGSMEKEAEPPEKDSVEGYRKLMEAYRIFYNTERPHCSLGMRTPLEVYHKTERQYLSVDEMIADAVEKSCSGDRGRDNRHVS